MLRPLTYAGRRGRRVHLRLSVILAAYTLSGPLPLNSQGPASPEISTRSVEPTFQLRSERNLVMVRVVVRNDKGEAIDYLHQENFQLFDQGKKQPIIQFSVEKPSLEADTVPAQKSAGATTAPGAVSGPPTTAILPHRFVALYFDDVNTGISGLARTRDAAGRFLQGSVHAGDRMGVFTSSGQNPLDFTDDLAKVRQALADLRPRPLFGTNQAYGEMSPYEAYLIAILNDPSALSLAIDQEEVRATRSGGQAPTAPAPQAAQLVDPMTSQAGRNALAEAQRILAATESKAKVTLGGIQSLVGRMSVLPGQRSLIVVSDGFLSQTLGESLGEISERALRANVIINALDARGLYVGLVTADASVAGRDLPEDPNMRSLKERLMREQAVRETDAMGTLALNTGGILYENNNDLEAGFRRVAAVPGAFYTLAFSPENIKHDGTFHTLKVTLVASKGLTAEARKGYYAPRKVEDLAIRGREDLQDAVFSQNEMQGLPIEVNTHYFMIDKSTAEIDVVTHVDLRQIHFRKEGDRNLGNLTIVTGLFDRDGHYVTGQQKALELRLRDLSLERVLQTGIRIETEMNAKPGTYLARTVVRDAGSGQTSALNRTVEIPY